MVFCEDLLATNAADSIVAELNSGPCKSLDSRLQVIDLDDDAIPTARLSLASVGHPRPVGGAWTGGGGLVYRRFGWLIRGSNWRDARDRCRGWFCWWLGYLCGGERGTGAVVSGFFPEYVVLFKPV